MFSIITPTFNRADTLHRVYNSLKKQTFKEFHWVIIDDCSLDQTDQLVQEWIAKEEHIMIEYHKLENNKGKPYALNYGLQFCKQPITIIADSDDSFVPNTLLDLNLIWNNINKTEDGKKIGSVWTIVMDEDGEIVGEQFPKNFWQVNFKERVLNRKKPIAGEKWHSWRTDVLSNYKLFHNDNTIHVGESASWHKINIDFDFLCINIAHRTYWQSEDGLINQKKSNLKVAKIKYYTTFYQLKDISIYKIISKNYYRNLSFDYIKSSFLYKDRNNRLNIVKRLLSFVNFLFILPKKIIKRL